MYTLFMHLGLWVPSGCGIGLKFNLCAPNLQSPRSRIRQEAIAATFVSPDCDYGSVSGGFVFPEV